MKKLMVAATAVAALYGSPAISASGGKLGKVSFETSCKPAAQKLFNQGMLYQHSFWYRAANRSFEEAIKADPQCAMAHWGIALSLLYNPHAPPPS